jgi:hypothetical protein
MPCDSIRQTRVAIQQVTDNVFDIGQRERALLDLALKALGFSARQYQYDGDQLTIQTVGRLRLTLDQIKVAYSTEVVKATAKKYGWKLRLEETNTQGEQQFTFKKAMF